MGGWFKEYKPGDPVRLVANVEETNRVHRILDDVQGIGCRIEKPRNANGRGWRIIVDGTSDLDPIPDSDVGTDTDQVPVKPYDIHNAIGVPRGAILIWAGQKADIPPGWALCDGTRGTPDLSGRFLMATQYDDGDTGRPSGRLKVGQVSGTIYNHEMRHDHSTDNDNGLYARDSTLTTDPQTYKYFVRGTAVDSAAAGCPVYAIAYIMKL